MKIFNFHICEVSIFKRCVCTQKLYGEQVYGIMIIIIHSISLFCLVDLECQYLRYCQGYNPSMRSKKIVYFNQNTPDSMNSRRDSHNKALSINKGLRETSTNKQPKFHHKQSPSVRLSANQKGGNAQKIRVLLTREGLIFEKKYMIYDIQCALLKTQKVGGTPTSLDSSTSSASSVSSAQQCTIPPLSFEQPIIQAQNSNEDIIYLNFETSSMGVTKNNVRHNFPIQRDNSNYIEVRAVGFSVENLTIANKKIEFVAFDNTSHEDHEITIIQPIKSVEQSQSVRQQKMNAYFQRLANIKEGRPFNRSMDFCWSLDSSVDNAQMTVPAKAHAKKNEIQCGVTFSNQIMANLFNQNGNQTQRSSSNSKRISQNLSGISNASSTNYTTETKTAKQTANMQRSGLVDLMRPTKQSMLTPSGKPKVTSRKFLNDSGLSYGIFNKMQSGNGKENSKKQDAYGLEDAKKCRNRTQNQDSKKTAQLQIDHRTIDIELNRYGLHKKHP